MAKFISKKKRQESIVRKHITSLFGLIRGDLSSEGFAQRYMWLIRRISMKYNYELPREIKHSYCKHCKTLFVPGENCRVRLHRKRVIYTCYSCNKFTRLPYKK